MDAGSDAGADSGAGLSANSDGGSDPSQVDMQNLDLNLEDLAPGNQVAVGTEERAGEILAEAEGTVTEGASDAEGATDPASAGDRGSDLPTGLVDDDFPEQAAQAAMAADAAAAAGAGDVVDAGSGSAESAGGDAGAGTDAGSAGDTGGNDAPAPDSPPDDS